jgi:hypothetical protein
LLFCCSLSNLIDIFYLTIASLHFSMNNLMWVLHSHTKQGPVSNM